MKARVQSVQLPNDFACENGRRGRQDIILGILKLAARGETRAHLVSKLNLSSAQCSKYLEELTKVGYMTEKSGVWETTEKGFQVIDSCAICHRLMKLTQQK